MSSTKTIVEYSIDAFHELLKQRLFGPLCAEVAFVIQEVDSDPLDRYPGTLAVTKVRVSYEGDRLDAVESMIKAEGEE